MFSDWEELGITAIEELVKQAEGTMSLFPYRRISGKERFLWYLFLNEENCSQQAGRDIIPLLTTLQLHQAMLHIWKHKTEESRSYFSHLPFNILLLIK